MTNKINASSRGDRRTHFEETLRNYPNIDDCELADLLRWIRKEATALDTGQIASDPNLREPYQRLKADHLEPLRGVDLLWAAAFVMMLAIVIGLIAWGAM